MICTTYGSECASCRRGSSLLKKGTGKLLRDIKKGKPLGAFPFLYLPEVLWFFLSRKNSPRGLSGIHRCKRCLIIAFFHNSIDFEAKSE